MSVRWDVSCNDRDYRMVVKKSILNKILIVIYELPYNTEVFSVIYAANVKLAHILEDLRPILPCLTVEELAGFIQAA